MKCVNGHNWLQMLSKSKEEIAKMSPTLQLDENKYNPSLCPIDGSDVLIELSDCKSLSSPHPKKEEVE